MWRCRRSQVRTSATERIPRKIIELDPPQGFAAEATAASVLYVASLGMGAPISTTHPDTATGDRRWESSALGPSTASGHAVTDGERLIAATAEGGVSAVDLATGVPAWTLPAAAIGNLAGTEGRALTFAVGDRLVTLTDTTITGFAPTGPRAIIPGTEREPDTGSGGTTYVTPCGSSPVFEPQTFRTAAGGLVVTMKVTARCPAGDVLYGPRTRITISDGSGLIASGDFDFRRTPVAVPSLDDVGRR